MRYLFFILLFFVLPYFTEAENHPLFAAAEIQFNQKNYEAALVGFNQLLQEFPEKKECYFNRGLCLYKAEKFSEAIFDFDESISMDSALADAQLMKGFSLEKRGDLKEAMAVYKNFPESNTNHTLLNRRIKNYQLAVIVSSKWYYMIAMMLVVILLMAVVVKTSSYRKG